MEFTYAIIQGVLYFFFGISVFGIVHNLGILNQIRKYQGNKSNLVNKEITERVLSKLDYRKAKSVTDQMMSKTMIPLGLAKLWLPNIHSEDVLPQEELLNRTCSNRDHVHVDFMIRANDGVFEVKIYGNPSVKKEMVLSMLTMFIKEVEISTIINPHAEIEIEDIDMDKLKDLGL